MQKFTVISTMVVLAAIVVAPVQAKPTFNNVALETPNDTLVLRLPSLAGTPSVVPLGPAVDPVTGLPVEGFAIIDYREGFHHKDGHDGGPGGGGPPGGGNGDESQCFSYIFEGKTKWKSVEDWVVNTSNNGSSLGDAFVLNTIEADIAKWELAAGKDILGAGTTTTSTLVADEVSPDGVNEVYFADIADANVIAVTIVWKTAFKNQLIEWDMVFDDVDVDWTEDAVLESTKMDFSNIDTHELGHAVGMGHTDDTAVCEEETMFPTAIDGETKKRDLNAGDIEGVAKLY